VLDGGDAPRIESAGADVLRSLGLEAIIEFLETTAYGVCVTGEDHTWVYLNPAGARIMGQPLEDLRGKDYTLHFPPHERAVLLALESTQRQGDTDFYTNTVVRPDGNDLEMTWSGTVMHAGGVELAPAIFHETTPVRRAQRSAAELGAAAVHTDQGQARADVLASLVAEAVASSRASAAVLLCESLDGCVQVTASSGADPSVADVVAASAARLSDVVFVSELGERRGVYVPDAADQLSAATRTHSWVQAMAAEPWRGAALFGVRRDGQVVGVLLALIPEALAAPSEQELVLWASLADQAGVALGADRIREHVSRHSVLTERSRIARDLHDSVSQALFSLHARAQVVRRALAADDTALAMEAAQDLEMLSRQATTEMRVLLGDMRSEVSDGDDLVSRLHELVDTVRVREELAVELSVSPARLPSLPPGVAEHLPRILGEALHNTVKHARASRVSVALDVRDDALTLVAADDGRGFDTSTSGGGMGQQTMRERAALLGGVTEVDSSPGGGTTVRVRVPLNP
jgi:PAS domain S-box-containing protein